VSEKSPDVAEVIRQRYEVLAAAGRGGQGEVLRAVDRVHHRQVAIKVQEIRSEDQRQALLQEARILFSARPHPNLPLLREDFVVGDRYYLVMDWVEGRNLGQVLDEEGEPGLSLSRVLEWSAQAAEALDHLHDHDPPIVHGDVKPSNLILTRQGLLVLVDFGISSRWPAAAHERRASPDYAAPELGTIGAAPGLDIYGLAATAYTLLTGAPPRPETRPAIAGLASGKAAGVIRALRRGLAVDPARRPASAPALVEAMRAGAGAVARPAVPRRRRVVSLMLTLTALVVAAVVVVALWPRRSTVVAPPPVKEFTVFADLDPQGATGSAPNVMPISHGTVGVRLRDFASGDELPVRVSLVFDSPLFPQVQLGERAGDFAAGTDADSIFGGTVNLAGNTALEAVDTSSKLRFTNLDPETRYRITVTANRNEPTYAGARYTRVTIEGAESFANHSSEGVEIDCPRFRSCASVSFSTGFNLTNGYVARWTGVTAPDGTFAINSAWDPGRGVGPMNIKGYAMSAFKLEVEGPSSGSPRR
jgi:tRNA A-37 threonylcarbamoyl transferase component Bud32